MRITEFIVRDSIIYAVGSITKIKGLHPHSDGVELLTSRTFEFHVLTDTTSAVAAAVVQLASCDILNLALGPLDLNLLGLEVHLNQVVLDIAFVFMSFNKANHINSLLTNTSSDPWFSQDKSNISRTMKELKTLNDLLKHEVQVLYEAEKLQTLSLPRMIKKTSSQELKNVLQMHLDQTEKQIERLEKAAKLLSIDPSADKNPSIVGLVAEGELVLHKDATPETLDATLLAGVQKVEHYEIAGYGTAANLAEELGMVQVWELLSTTLKEEKEADAKLTELAKSKINRKAEKINR